MKIYNSEKILSEAVERCLAELYYFAQPSVENIEEAVKKEGDSQDEPFYQKHYLSKEDYEYIIDKYIKMYNLEDYFKQDCNVLIRDLKEGYSVNKFTEYGRDYERKPNLETQLESKEIADKVIDIIENRKNFYRFYRDGEKLRFNILNYGPTSNKQQVIDYWKSQGIDIEIKDYNPDYNYERLELGLSDEEIQEIIEEEEKENEYFYKTLKNEKSTN